MGSILSMQWPVSGSRQRSAPKWPDAVLAFSGTLLQFRGRVSVLRGLFLHDDGLRARGYREQLVGLLQRIWCRDRRSVEAWVDGLMQRTPITPRSISGQRWVRPRAHSSLQPES